MIKLYALRDRLVDYYLQPFTGPSDKQVIASLANVINEEGNTSAIAKTPSHFELWRLAEIDETTGQVEGDREFLCDAGSLIRGGIRGTGADDAGEGTLDGPAGQRGGETGGPAGRGNTSERAPTGATQAENRQGAEIDPRPVGTA